MATNFTDIFDRIRVVVPTLTGFATKTELFNPYNLEDNSSAAQSDGWGLIVAEGGPSATQEFGNVYEDAGFGIVLTREYKSTAHNRDPSLTVAKALMEDLVTLKLDFMNVDQIGISGDVENIIYVSRSGISSVSLEKSKVLTANIVFNFIIKEAF